MHNVMFRSRLADGTVSRRPATQAFCTQWPGASKRHRSLGRDPEHCPKRLSLGWACLLSGSAPIRGFGNCGLDWEASRGTFPNTGAAPPALTAVFRSSLPRGGWPAANGDGEGTWVPELATRGLANTNNGAAPRPEHKAIQRQGSVPTTLDPLTGKTWRRVPERVACKPSLRLHDVRRDKRNGRRLRATRSSLRVSARREQRERRQC